MPDTSTSFDPNQPYNYGGYEYQFDTPERRAAYTQQSQNAVNPLPADPYAARDMGDEYYKALGYSGPTWNYGYGGEANTAEPTITPELQSWLDQKGYVYGLGGKGYDRSSGYFDSSGNPVGAQHQGSEKGEFGKAMLPIAAFTGAGLATGAFGGGAASATGAGAGAGAPGAGSIASSPWGAYAAESVAPTAMGALTPEAITAAYPMGPLASLPYDAAAIGQATGSAGSPTGFEAMPAGGGPAPITGAAPTSSIPQNLVDKAIGAVTNNPLGAAQIGLAGYGMVKQGQGGTQAQNQFNQVAQPVKDVSNELLNRFRTGQISGADAFAIQDWQQKQKAATDQYFAQAGLSNSSMHLDATSRITQQAEGMRQQAIQNLLSGGLRAAGVSDPTLVAGINAGLKQDQASQDAMAQFLATLAQMNTGAPPPAAAAAPAPATQTGTPG